MRTERRIRAGFAALGSLSLVLSGAVPALARSAPADGFSHSSGLRLAALANATSTGYGGWTFTSKTATTVTARFRVPSLTCTSATSGVAPVAALVTGTTTSPNFNAAGLFLECSGGSPTMAPTVVVDGAWTVGSTPVAPGDLIKSTVTTFVATFTTIATVVDLTTGHTFKLTRSGVGEDATPFYEAIIDSALVSKKTHKQLPVANFGKIAFRAGTVGGQAIGSVTPRFAFNMQTPAKVLQILTGPITGAKKNTFVTVWRHA